MSSQTLRSAIVSASWPWWVKFSHKLAAMAFLEARSSGAGYVTLTEIKNGNYFCAKRTLRWTAHLNKVVRLCRVCDRFRSVLPLVEVVGSGYCLLVFWKDVPVFAVFDQKWTSLKSISRCSAPDWGSQKLFILAQNGPVWNRLAEVQLRIGGPKNCPFWPKTDQFEID